MKKREATRQTPATSASQSFDQIHFRSFLIIHSRQNDKYRTAWSFEQHKTKRKQKDKNIQQVGFANGHPLHC